METNDGTREEEQEEIQQRVLVAAERKQVGECAGNRPFGG